MKGILKRTLLFGTLGVLLLAGSPARQEPLVERYPTGLIPLTAAELHEIETLWPRVSRVYVNWLGFERLNEVRSRKGEPPLDPSYVRPIGREVESVIKGSGTAVQALAASPDLLGNLPVSVDNSKLKYFPPIRSQSPLGSCAAFSTTYTQLSYMAAFQRDLDIRNNADNTNKYSPKWTYNMINRGSDEGSSLYESYKLFENHGACTWAEFPYDSDFRAWCLNPAVWRNALRARTDPPQALHPVSTVEGIRLAKELLNNGYLLVFATYILSWQGRSILDDPSTADDDSEVGKHISFWMDGEEGGHAMAIVGYNDAIWTDINGNGLIDPGEKGAFRIANSWGAQWRDAGFTWLAYDALRSVSAVPGGPSAGRVQAISYDRAYIVTLRNASPLLIGEFTVNHAKRNQLRMSLGHSATSATIPSTTWTASAVSNHGGPYAFDGTTTAVDGTFVFDFSDILVAGGGLLRYYLGMHDNTAGDPATLKAFKIIDLTTNPVTEIVSALVPQTADGRQQVYAYADYAYPGPPYNHPPRLSYPQFSPSQGRTNDTFSFSVWYYDQNGDLPTVKDVYVAGVPYAMAYEGSGNSASDGWYVCRTTLPAGRHDYYFLFGDGRGGSARLPVAGAFSGPEVFDLLITSLAPSSATAGNPAFTLTVAGSQFLNGAVVTWDGSDRPTAFVSASELRAQIGAGDLATARFVPVAVRNPGGGVSNALTFTVNNPVPVLTSLSPARVTGGGSGFVLTLQGSSFVPGSVARWNGVNKTTTYVSGTQIQTNISAAEIAAGGDVEVTVYNPFPGGGESGKVIFPVSGFILGSQPASVTVNAGQSATYTIQVTPVFGSFDASIALSCTGLPAGCTATFSPASVTPGADVVTSTLTVTTKARQSAGASALFASAGGMPTALGLLLALPVLLIWRRYGLAVPGSPARRRLMACALICLIVLIGGCSAGGGGGGTPGGGTPAGNYNLSVKGTAGNLSVSAYVTLVVN